MKPEICLFYDQFLYSLGFREGWKGLDYLREAVEIYRPGYMITKEVYPVIARRNDTTSGAVEKACRHAIIEAWKKGNDTQWHKLLGDQLFRPTVQQFVATIRRYWYGNDAE